MASGLGVDWLQAPLVGIATVIGDDLPGGVATGLEVFIGLSAALVLVTAIVTSLAGAERLAFSMARYEMLPHVFARPERGAAPTAAATLAATLIAGFLLIISDAVGDGAQFLASLYSFGVLIALTAAQVAVVRLRIREPDLERPFRVPWGVRIRGAVVPVPAVVGAILTGALWVAALFTHEAARIAGPIWLAARRRRLPDVAPGGGGEPARAGHARGSRPRPRRRVRRAADPGAAEARRDRPGGACHGAASRGGGRRSGVRRARHQDPDVAAPGRAGSGRGGGWARGPRGGA